MPLTGVPVELGRRDHRTGRRWWSRSTTTRGPPAVRPERGRHRVRGERRGQLTRFAAVFQSRTPTRSGRSARVARRTSTCSAAERRVRVERRQRRRHATLIRELRPHQPRRRRSRRGYYRRSGRGGAPAQPVLEHRRAVGERAARAMAAPPPQLLVPPPGGDVHGTAGDGVDVPMDGVAVRWEWDADDGVYLRSERRAATTTEGDGQVIADNVVVMGVDYRPQPGRRQQPRGADARLRRGVRVHRRACAHRACGPDLDRLDPYALGRRRRLAHRTDAGPHVGRAAPTTPRTSSRCAGLTGSDPTTEPPAAIGTMGA